MGLDVRHRHAGSLQDAGGQGAVLPRSEGEIVPMLGPGRRWQDIGQFERLLGRTPQRLRVGKTRTHAAQRLRRDIDGSGDLAQRRVRMLREPGNDLLSARRRIHRPYPAAPTDANVTPIDRNRAARTRCFELDMPSGEARERLARARFAVRAALDRHARL